MSEAIQSLVREIKRCPTLEPTVTPKLVHELWGCLQAVNPRQGDAVTSAMLVALILFDEQSFADLLTEDQLDQLQIIAAQVLHNYEAAIKPKNQVGQLLATTIKENQNI
jgi:hypothetical protein